jgi:hypothetical protein
MYIHKMLQFTEHVFIFLNETVADLLNLSGPFLWRFWVSFNFLLQTVKILKVRAVRFGITCDRRKIYYLGLMRYQNLCQ